MKYVPPKSNLFPLIQRKKPIKNILLYAQAYLPSGEKIILIKGGIKKVNIPVMIVISPAVIYLILKSIKEENSVYKNKIIKIKVLLFIFLTTY